jgi:hypothetical protein
MAMNEDNFHEAIRKTHYPERISVYLKNHFDQPFISDVQRVKDKRGNVFFKVNVSDENTLYRLRFNEEGAMILKETEPLIELDDNEYEIID